MARIVVITHTYDDFRRRKFLLGSLARHWIEAGHDVSVAAGLGDWPAGDIAVMHLDLSVVPAAYLEASRRYPRVVNVGARDIRKRVVSRHRVLPDDGWQGPVIVKTDLNCRGIPELNAIDAFQRDGRPPDLAAGPVVTTPYPYPVLRSARDVPDAIWRNDGLVVERFLPERDARGYWMRVWVFFGDRERCSRYCGPEPVIKSAQIIAREKVPVPDLLRAERERLGFDFGKFDFVVIGGQPVLLDANRTPSAPPPGPEMDASNAYLAGGLAALLSAAS
jgi:hypothetical protein